MDGEAVHFYGAREGVALPLVEFDFKEFDLNILTFLPYLWYNINIAAYSLSPTCTAGGLICRAFVVISSY
jgi:hypothetical protein